MPEDEQANDQELLRFLLELSQQSSGQPAAPTPAPTQNLGQPPGDLAQALAQREARFGAGTSGSGAPALNIMPSQATQDFGVFAPADLQNIANTVGYAGPTRPDERSGAIGQTMTPAETKQLDEERRIRGLPSPTGGTFGELQDILQGLKGLPEQVRMQLLAERFPNIKVGNEGETKLNQQKELARFKAELAKPAQEAKLDERLRAAQERVDALQARQHVPFAQAQKTLKAMADSGVSQEVMAAALANMNLGQAGEIEPGALGKLRGKSAMPIVGVKGAKTQVALPKAPTPGAKLPAVLAQRYVAAAGGDKARAIKAARADGWDDRR